MRTKLTAKIDQINNMCSLPLNPRDIQGQPVNPFTTSIQDIHTTVSGLSRMGPSRCLILFRSFLLSIKFVRRRLGEEFLRQAGTKRRLKNQLPQRSFVL